MKYKLTIEKINKYSEIENFVNFISYVTWRITATDEDENIGYTEAVFGFKIEDTSNFIDFNNLTENEVVGWVESRLGENGIAHFKELAVKNINKNNSIVSEEVIAPWVNQNPLGK
tara:strand:+ start:354 stop:698 length:345 start_codon:yes stop_codon:yes gene_type:complete